MKNFRSVLMDLQKTITESAFNKFQLKMNHDAENI